MSPNLFFICIFIGIVELSDIYDVFGSVDFSSDITIMFLLFILIFPVTVLELWVKRHSFDDWIDLSAEDTEIRRAWNMC